MFHLVGLWADSYVSFGPSQFFLPMASSWKPGAVTVGVLAFYGLIAVEATSLVMARLPKRLWHAVHLTSYAVFLAGTIHMLWAGTDSSHAALRWSAVCAVSTAVFFLVYRIIGPGRRASAKTARPVSTM